MLKWIIKSPNTASFNKIQAYVYPEACKFHFNEAMKCCTQEQQKRQRNIANLFIRDIF